MLLATRCPFCETVFRLQPPQLAQRRGLVRCGHCQEVFDASSSLFETGGDGSTVIPVPAASAPAASADAPPAASQPAPDFRAASWDPWSPVADAVFEPRLHLDPNVLPRAPTAAVDAAPHVPAESFEAPAGEPHEPSLRASHADVPERQPEPAFAATPPAEHAGRAGREPHFGTQSPEPFTAAPRDDADAFAVVRETREPEARGSGWRIAGVLLALALFVILIAQLAWWQRETAMVYWPPSQKLFVGICAQLGCEAGQPRDIDGFVIETPDLRQLDDPHKLEFRLPLRNRFNVALAYPAIELTLLDAKNDVAVRRVLWPQDYVKPGTPIAAGLPARTMQTMLVRLDTGNVLASNFRVQIFYP